MNKQYKVYSRWPGLDLPRQRPADPVNGLAVVPDVGATDGGGGRQQGGEHGGLRAPVHGEVALVAGDSHHVVSGQGFVSLNPFFSI